MSRMFDTGRSASRGDSAVVLPGQPGAGTATCGGWRPRRHCTKLVHDLTKQVDAIRFAPGHPLIGEFAFEPRATLCFVDAEWSLFAKPFALHVWIGWPNPLGERLRAAGKRAPEHLMALAQRVALPLPAA